jgi:hypothetical protein
VPMRKVSAFAIEPAESMLSVASASVRIFLVDVVNI